MSDKLDAMGEMLYRLGLSTYFRDGGYYVVNGAGEVVVGPCDSLEELAEEVVL